MTKDKYNLFGKKRAKVPRKASDPSEPPPLRMLKACREEPTPTYDIKISKLEPPEDPRQEPVKYIIKIIPLKKASPERPVPVKQDTVPQPVIKAVATSTKAFFSAVKPLAAQPLLKIPEKTVLKEVVAPPLGSREAKLRDFISKHF